MTTADPIEWIWTLVAALGLIAALLVFGITLGDLMRIRANSALSPRERIDQTLVAKMNRRNQGVASYLQTVMLVIGIRALFLPPNPASSELGTLIVGIVFVSGAGLLTWSSILTLIDRIRFDRMGRAAQKGGAE
jgi:hypothetical protein